MRTGTVTLDYKAIDTPSFIPIAAKMAKKILEN
jgi:queuine/archaeosine tRNA-ribosyltransferase